eukprot:942162-Pyramimonas_sp.AAC.1
MIRKVCTEAIAQATAAAKTNPALRTKTLVTGQRYYDEGYLVDYHRPTTSKGDWGGWNGSFPVVRNDSKKGSSHRSSGKPRRSGTIRRCTTFTLY